MASPTDLASAMIRRSVTDHPHLPSNLAGQLAKRRADLTQDLIYASDWADYRNRVGVIAGFGEAIEMCGNIERDMRSEK